MPSPPLLDCTRGHHASSEPASRHTPWEAALLCGEAVRVGELDPLLSDEGWPYASALPVGSGDPGRFHALFGRDSLITSLQILPVQPEVARSTLRALARRQGTRCDPEIEEEPG